MVSMGQPACDYVALPVLVGPMRQWIREFTSTRDPALSSPMLPPRMRWMKLNKMTTWSTAGCEQGCECVCLTQR